MTIVAKFVWKMLAAFAIAVSIAGWLSLFQGITRRFMDPSK